MATRKLLWLPIAAASLFAATCAPVEQRVVEEKKRGPEIVLPPENAEKLQPPKPSVDPARDRVEAAIQNVRDRDLKITHGFWTVFHGILGLGPGVKLLNPPGRDAKNFEYTVIDEKGEMRTVLVKPGEKVNSVEYVAGGGEMAGLIFLQTKYGLDVESSRGLNDIGEKQGHQDQFICEMGQWGCPPDRPFIVLGKEYKFIDFINHSQMRASLTKKQELSWAIALLAQYKGVDMPPWENRFGEKMTLEDMVRYEVNASIEDAACGGTHRLFGLSWAYHLHLLNGGKTEGVWKDVAERTTKYINLAKKYQNPDGTFSTNHFREPGDNPDKTARISTTGHILEWLCLALSDEEIKEEWVQRAASALSLLILDLQDQGIDGGSLYHATHGLQLYHARVYGPSSFTPKELMIPPAPKKDTRTAAK